MKAHLDTAYAQALRGVGIASDQGRRRGGHGERGVPWPRRGVAECAQLDTAPVFQSYSAYTERLLQMNTQFFEGDQAPQFVLFRAEAIDGRFPMLEDSGVMLELLRRYRPVLTEKTFLLMQRRGERKVGGAAQPCRHVERHD